MSLVQRSTNVGSVGSALNGIRIALALPDTGPASPSLGVARTRWMNLLVLSQPLYFDDHEDAVKLAREVGWDVCVFVSILDLLTHPRLRNLLEA